MRVLWVSNVAVSDSPLLGHSAQPFGGWIESGSRALANLADVELTVCAPGAGQKLEIGRGALATHALLPAKSQRSAMEEIIGTVRPDIVHIHGTEFPHSLAASSVAKRYGIRSIVSIQGFMGAYAEAYFSGVPDWVKYRYSVRDILRMENLWSAGRKFSRQAQVEHEVLSEASAAIGRTEWDRACVASVNPQLTYYRNNETLRSSFYSETWSLNAARPNSIFVSQGHYPLKGVHYVLHALPVVLDKFPNTVLRIAGADPTRSSEPLSIFRRTSYGAYLARLIKQYGIAGNVEFLGVLTEQDMLAELLSSEVFLTPSALENSPNSLGEAMLVGIPTVSSYVGGIPSMASDETTSFFPSGDFRLLAQRLIDQFTNPSPGMARAAAAQLRARQVHDPKTNMDDLLEIYRQVLSTRLGEGAT